MLSASWRPGVVLALVLAAGCLSNLVRPPAYTATVPSIRGLLTGTGWQVQGAGTPGWSGPHYKQWVLHARNGAEARLYIEATTQVQRSLHWSGELGFEGAGYEVISQAELRIHLDDGRMATVAVTIVQGGSDREALAYAVLSPDGIAPHGTTNLWQTTWDVLRGQSGPYYLIRVARTIGAGSASQRPAATTLLARVLSRLASVPVDAAR